MGGILFPSRHGPIIIFDVAKMRAWRKNVDFATRCVHTTPRIPDSLNPVVNPLYLTSSFSHTYVGQEDGYSYTRMQNPTREAVEDTIRDLEEGTDCIAFASGMAAIACVMELFKPGDRIVSGHDLYGGSIRLFNHVTAKNGVLVSVVDTSDLDAVREALADGASALYVETPTNPLMVVSDIRALADLAHDAGALLIVDNTFLTPYFQRPLTLGADIVVHSGTKYLAGHNDVICGLVVCGDQGLSDRLRFIYKTLGSGLDPFDSWLLARGIKTLPLRMRRHESNAKELALWLLACPFVEEVLYPGLETHPGHELCKRQGDGFGGMLSFYVKSEKLARSVLTKLHLIMFAESLGGAESLITYPITQTHADVPPEELAQKGIDGRLLRLSVGLEEPSDIIYDLESAFEAARLEVGE